MSSSSDPDSNWRRPCGCTIEVFCDECNRLTVDSGSFVASLNKPLRCQHCTLGPYECRCGYPKEDPRIPSRSPEPGSDYEKLGVEIGRLVCDKQAAYGDSFGKSGEVMRLLYPDGIRPEQMDDALFLTRMLDKMFRIATKKDAFGENPSEDMMGYCLLHASKERKKQKETF